MIGLFEEFFGTPLLHGQQIAGCPKMFPGVSQSCLRVKISAKSGKSLFSSVFCMGAGVSGKCCYDIFPLLATSLCLSGDGLHYSYIERKLFWTV